MSTSEAKLMVTLQLRNLVPALASCSDEDILSTKTLEITGARGGLNIGMLQGLVSLTLIEPFEVDESIGKLKGLERLDIRSSQQPLSLPIEMGRLTSLKSWTLYCKRVGEISPEVFSMESLKTLYLDCMEIERLSLREVPAGCDLCIRNHTARLNFAGKFFPTLGKDMILARPDHRHATVKFKAALVHRYYTKIDNKIYGVAKSAILVTKAIWRANERLYAPGGIGFRLEKRKWSQISSTES